MKTSMIYKFRRKCQYIAYSIIPAEVLSKLYCRIVIGYKPNLEEPKTLNEKLQWLKLNFYPFNSDVIMCADKYTVRSYVEAKGFGDFLNDLYNVWDDVNEINWEQLPEQFVMKCTHGCGYNIICDSKEILDSDEAKKKIRKWMNEDFGRFNVEPHYNKTKHRIICEKYLGEDIVDYKFFCLNGEVKFMYIAQGFGKGINERMTFFDENGNIAPFQRDDYKQNETAVLPDQFEEMKRMSKILSKYFPFVRVDWFEVEGRVYFGELTFTPGGCMMNFSPKEYDFKLGQLLEIHEYIKSF